MIKIRIHPDLFETNGQFKKTTPFYGIDPQKAIISISTGKIAEGWVKINGTGRSDDDAGYDGTSSLKVGESGLSMTDTMFYYMINNSQALQNFGLQILSLVEEGRIEVSQDGVVLTVPNIIGFTL